MGLEFVFTDRNRNANGQIVTNPTFQLEPNHIIDPTDTKARHPEAARLDINSKHTTNVSSKNPVYITSSNSRRVSSTDRSAAKVSIMPTVFLYPSSFVDQNDRYIVRHGLRVLNEPTIPLTLKSKNGGTGLAALANQVVNEGHYAIGLPISGADLIVRQEQNPDFTHLSVPLPGSVIHPLFPSDILPEGIIGARMAFFNVLGRALVLGDIRLVVPVRRWTTKKNTGNTPIPRFFSECFMYTPPGGVEEPIELSFWEDSEASNKILACEYAEIFELMITINNLICESGMETDQSGDRSLSEPVLQQIKGILRLNDYLAFQAGSRSIPFNEFCDKQLPNSGKGAVVKPMTQLDELQEHPLYIRGVRRESLSTINEEDKYLLAGGGIIVDTTDSTLRHLVNPVNRADNAVACDKWFSLSNALRRHFRTGQEWVPMTLSEIESIFGLQGLIEKVQGAASENTQKQHNQLIKNTFPDGRPYTRNMSDAVDRLDALDILTNQVQQLEAEVLVSNINNFYIEEWEIENLADQLAHVYQNAVTTLVKVACTRTRASSLWFNNTSKMGVALLNALNTDDFTRIRDILCGQENSAPLTYDGMLNAALNTHEKAAFGNKPKKAFYAKHLSPFFARLKNTDAGLLQPDTKIQDQAPQIPLQSNVSP